MTNKKASCIILYTNCILVYNVAEMRNIERTAQIENAGFTTKGKIQNKEINAKIQSKEIKKYEAKK